LHRPPPETRTFESNLLVFSSIFTSNAGFKSLQLIAAKNPAAPPPITIMRFVLITFI
jgi:hypothetical protein